MKTAQCCIKGRQKLRMLRNLIYSAKNLCFFWQCNIPKRIIIGMPSLIKSTTTTMTETHISILGDCFPMSLKGGEAEKKTGLSDMT